MSCDGQFLLETVEQYLRHTGLSPSRFGRSVAGDPRLVFDMRRGRTLNTPLSDRVLGATQEIKTGRHKVRLTTIKLVEGLCRERI